ncbi:hypothetical protein BJV78DRAFT_1211555, partial [Lactifluus subvellereus]
HTSFSPGDVVSPTSTNPYFSPYAQDVMVSPVLSNVPDYYYHNLPVPRPRLRPSLGSLTSGPYSPVVSSPRTTDPHYADLSRSSVTPFQAAQYAEITEKLRTAMSSVLGAVPEDPHRAVPNDITPVSYADIPLRDENASTKSPFANPGNEHPDADVSHELDIESLLVQVCSSIHASLVPADTPRDTRP